MERQKKFRKAERLKHRKAIGALFDRRSPSFGQYPVRLIYRQSEHGWQGSPVRVAFSVPKRKFPKAVDRNRIRRQLKEAWRLHKPTLYEGLPEHQPTYNFMILYVAKEAVPFSAIEKAIRAMIRRFLKTAGATNRT